MAGLPDATTEILTVNLNQDYSSIAVGTRRGYRLYSLNNADKLEQLHEETVPPLMLRNVEDVCMVERLFSSSLIAIVSRSAPRKLKVCHFKKGSEICNYSYSNTILAVRLNRQRLVVCLEESIYIHNIRDMKVLHTIRDTPANPPGIIGLSYNADSSYVAYPGSLDQGEVQIFDALRLHGVTMLQAHDSPVATLAFCSQGKKLATASQKGTVVRVFSVPEGERLFEFRRGVKRNVAMSCLSFSADSQFLCSASNTETVHVYRLDAPKQPEAGEESSSSWMGYVSSALKTSAQYLPSNVTDVFSQERAVAFAHLPAADPAAKHYCCITRIRDTPYLLVASSTGSLYVYSFDPENGGECGLKKQHRLDQLVLGKSPDKQPLLAGGASYAATVQRHHDTVSQATPPLGSQPYQELDSPESQEAMQPTHFRLEDDNDFPPMMHQD